MSMPINTTIGNNNIAIGYSSIPQYNHQYNDVVSQTNDIIQYIDFSFKILGIDLDFSKFQEMGEDERKSFLRDIKINKII